jgi:hypothetical protein
VKAELHGFGARGDVVRATERRQKVVQRDFVGHVDYGEPQAPPIAVGAEQVVVTRREVEQIARRHAPGGPNVAVLEFRMRSDVWLPRGLAMVKPLYGKSIS